MSAEAGAGSTAVRAGAGAGSTAVEAVSAGAPAAKASAGESKAARTTGSESKAGAGESKLTPGVQAYIEASIKMRDVLPVMRRRMMEDIVAKEKKLRQVRVALAKRMHDDGLTCVRVADKVFACMPERAFKDTEYTAATVVQALTTQRKGEKKADEGARDPKKLTPAQRARLHKLLYGRHCARRAAHNRQERKRKREDQTVRMTAFYADGEAFDLETLEDLSLEGVA